MPNLVWGHSGAGFSCNDKLCQGNMQNGILSEFAEVGFYIFSQSLPSFLCCIKVEEFFRRWENVGGFMPGKSKLILIKF